MMLTSTIPIYSCKESRSLFMIAQVYVHETGLSCNSGTSKWYCITCALYGILHLTKMMEEMDEKL